MGVSEIGFSFNDAALLVFFAGKARARGVASDIEGLGEAACISIGFQFGFVLRGGLGVGGASFEELEVAVEEAFGAEAVGFDAGEGFRLDFVDEGVDAGGGGEFGFEAMAAVDVPGG